MMQFSENPVLAIFWIAVVALALSPAAAVAAMLLGWLWTPFAALICWLRARSLGLPPRRYAAIGALYSALFFLPWLYLALRMFGKTVSGPAVSIGCIFLYAVWFCGPIAFTFLARFSYGVSVFSSERADMGTAALQITAFCLTAVLLCVNVCAMIFSVIRFKEDRKRLDASEREGADLLPHRVYIMPFAHTFAAVAVTAPVSLALRFFAPH